MGVLVDVKEITKEYWVGKNRMYLKDDGIIYIDADGDIDKDLALKQIEIALQIHRVIQKKINLFIDLSNAGKQSPEARVLWREINQRAEINKIAYYGLNFISRIVASFIMGKLKKSNIRFFKSKSEAVQWLKEDNLFI